MNNPSLMAIFAHPDDEAFGTGGTLAKYAAWGADVYVVMATRGEAGEIATPDLARPANLPYVREQELRSACQAYGVHPPIFLDYQDGQLTIVHQGQAVAKLVRLIRELRPQVIITFGPDGIYGHYDHIAVHRWATIAFDLAADPDCFPDLLADVCDPHRVSKLYYRVMPEERVKAMAQEGRRAVMMDGVPFPFVGVPEEQITTVIDVGNHAAAKLSGIRCHVTQLGRQNRFVETPDEVMRDPGFRYETFMRAASRVAVPEGKETDLFAGLR